ncbi:hypothetical protein HYZ97_04920 [Candidatus Pacearchaeota archaeon]|nr:hypothetical protein [Candidatus Pacearchaeota archaeon]
MSSHWHDVSLLREDEPFIPMMPTLNNQSPECLASLLLIRLSTKVTTKDKTVVEDVVFVSVSSSDESIWENFALNGDLRGCIIHEQKLMDATIVFTKPETKDRALVHVSVKSYTYILRTGRSHHSTLDKVVMSD